MAARPQQSNSITSLGRYASPRQPGFDPFNGSDSRDYCTSFWGPGDAGPNLMFARMRGATKTTDELKNYWSERCGGYYSSGLVGTRLTVALAGAS